MTVSVSDEDGIAALLGERPGETRPFCCDPMRSDQKGACEKNHVEIRKLVPKGRGYRLDRLEREDAALLMSQINSTPRGALAFMSPIQMFRAAFGEDAERLLDALGVELPGGERLNLTEGYLDEQRAKRGAAPLQGKALVEATEYGGRAPVSLSPEEAEAGRWRLPFRSERGTSP